MRDGEVIGVARFVREEPASSSAEVAVTVVDDWQGQGLGTLLLNRLSRRAREEGVETFTATALADNRAIIELLEGLGQTTVRSADSGQVDLEIELEGDVLRLLLRSAASGVANFLSGRLTTP